VIEEHLAESIRVLQATAEACGRDVEAAAETMLAALRREGKLLVCGNGGSAADAQHLAAELVNRLARGFERPAIAAISLTSYTSVLTACANDRGFDSVFARQIEAVGRPGDVLLLISSSGNSENLCRAALAAKQLRLFSIGLLGGDGGRLASLVDGTVIVPSSSTAHVQEAHGVIVHLLCGLIERGLYSENDATPPP
jgi:D-sedoheptulose 7-phosphate isomerase